MWTSTVGLVNGKHRYLTAETFGFKINSNGQQLRRRQQWTIEPFPEITGPDGSISSAASVTSQAPLPPMVGNTNGSSTTQLSSDSAALEPCTILTPLTGTGVRPSSNDSNSSETADGYAGEEHENVALKSHLNKYLAVDSFGNVTCDSDEKTENARFTITICSMSQGRSKDEHIFWAFKNVERGYYLGTTDQGMICCSAKMPKSRAELWHLHLLPARGASFFAIKSLGRKRFARQCQVDENNQPAGAQQVQLDANISWGSETLFQFKYYEGGRYSLLTSDNRLLNNEGKCVVWTATSELEVPPAECLFTLEYHSGYLAFRDSFGQYLAAAGRSSVLRSRSIGVSRDELFLFEGVPVQVSLKAIFNNRWVSIKQGVDLSANQAEPSSRFETFQLTYHKQTQNWSIMTHDANFWTISHNSSTGTVSVCRPGDYEGLTRGQFRLIWDDADSTLSLKYVDPMRQERWIAARKSGQLYLAPASGQEPVKFIMRLQNRRLLNLRPVEGSGFVGLRSAGGKLLEANKTTPDSIVVEYADCPSSLRVVTPSSSASECALQSKDPQSSGPFYKNDSINVFNIKLNHTKLGQSVFEKFTHTTQQEAANQKASEIDAITTNNSNNPTATPCSNEQISSGLAGQVHAKELDFGFDANNNEVDSGEHKGEKGGVESASAPSVASIINSFSSVKICSPSSQHANVFSNGEQQRVGSACVSRLASSFELASGATNISQLQEERVSSNGSTAHVQNDVSTIVNSNKEQAAIEYCYLKIYSSGKYLTINVDEVANTVVCDADSKLDAQQWRLELRSHNSIAIRASDTRAYMQLGTNGTIQMALCEPKDASLWEF